jgi:CO dehydrogenase/acetyl-CoA synthase delta subunit
MAALLLLLAGGDIMIMRHPDAVNLVRGFVHDLMSD